LTLTVVRNYSVPQLHSANCQGQSPRLQAWDYMIENGGRAVPELGHHVWQTSQSHTDWKCLIFQQPQQCSKHPHQEMASYGPDDKSLVIERWNMWRKKPNGESAYSFSHETRVRMKVAGVFVWEYFNGEVCFWMVHHNC